MNKFTFITLLLIGFFLVAVSYNANEKNDPIQDSTSNPFAPAADDAGNTLGLQTSKDKQPELKVGSPSNNMQVSDTPTSVKFTAEPLKDNPDSEIKRKINTPVPDITLKKDVDYKAVISTSMGDITIDLFEDLVPETVKNFVYLANTSYYDNVLFHRITPEIIQTGDPKGDGTGGPGYRFDDEKFDGQYTKGTVAMANAGPNTNGSQFFINVQDYEFPHLYTIFGRVVEGMDNVDKIGAVETQESLRGEKSDPVEPVFMTQVKIIEVAKAPTPDSQ